MTAVSDQEIAALILALLDIKGVGPKMACRLAVEHRDEINSARQFDAEFIDSLGIARIGKALASSPLSWDEHLDNALETLEKSRREGLSILCPLSEGYPKRMLANPSYPPILFCRGNVSCLNSRKSVAIVGTRNPTGFGLKMGRRLAEILAEDGYSIVSGLALGCDSAAHKGALDAGGPTIALLPVPLDGDVYPRSNKDLAERILASGGALVSEYPPGSEISDRRLLGNLVARDEWQPALADGLVVVETTVGGGTRHAVRHAVKSKTPVAAFDYSSNPKMGFRDDPRFGGNVELIDSGLASGIYEPSTVDGFKSRMDDYRISIARVLETGLPEAGSQMALQLR